ncbi:glycosyltransferase [Geobacter benzoatilyticus]|uniref:Glycosyltransferase n=1 Tax=Geobacter benzoatilyticus TaxID=2815309 RepID=A0ABX7Q0L9_9BACT|nr:glycosyltransferase [Geobacter benzoatilyticus]QSV44939.1 glycosyltransferase [Geobacter benzoatilyticus]
MGALGFVSLLEDVRLEGVAARDPFVTVIVTNYNYGKYVADCLRSIARQTYSNFKCIVVDDCSTDDSPGIIQAFISSGEAAGRFTFVRHETNRGQMGGFVTGLHHAEGSFVVYVDADDLLLEDFIEAHLYAHARFEPVAYTSSNQYQIDEYGEIVSGIHSDHKAKGRFKYVTSRPIYHPYWVWATTSSMMFRRSVLDLIVPGNTDTYRICADNYICHFANLVGGSLLIPTVHGCYRRHGSNHFSSNRILGGDHPTGDMERHPKHHEIRLGIFAHLCEKSDWFIPALSKGKFLKTVAKTVGPAELLKFASKLPPAFPVRQAATLCLLLRMGEVVRLVRAFVMPRTGCLKHQFSGDADILRLPGE